MRRSVRAESAVGSRRDQSELPGTQPFPGQQGARAGRPAPPVQPDPARQRHPGIRGNPLRQRPYPRRPPRCHRRRRSPANSPGAVRRPATEVDVGSLGRQRPRDHWKRWWLRRRTSRHFRVVREESWSSEPPYVVEPSTRTAAPVGIRRILRQPSGRRLLRHQRVLRTGDPAIELPSRCRR